MKPRTELDNAGALMGDVEDVFGQFPQGTIERTAWETLRAHIAAWRLQQHIKDPHRRMMRIRELRKQLDDVRSLFSEAGLIGS